MGPKDTRSLVQSICEHSDSCGSASPGTVVHNHHSGDRQTGDEFELADEVVVTAADSLGLLELVELILKDRPRLHRLLRDPSLQSDLIPRFLAISLAGFILFGIAISFVFNAASLWPKLTAVELYLGDRSQDLITFAAPKPAGVFASWVNESAFKLIAAYALGLVAATGVCLPSLYFYALLSGVRMTMLDVTAHALKAKATSAVALVGILPIYAAVGMGMVVFHAPSIVVQQSLMLGLLLPFIAGVWGTYSLYVGFAGLCDTLPAQRRERRACFLRRLVWSWAACYSAIMPVMVYTLWEALGT
ncbi:MAG: hypothetical protein WD648_08190 [Planctomycetaceae bacterium]